MLQRWRPWLHSSLIAVCLAALFAWVVSKTEWVDADIPRLPVGEAASDDFYVLKRVLRMVRVRTVSRDDLSQLPPPGATLLLSGWNWDLLPERTRALRSWVEQGGHLVIETNLLRRRPADGANWIPIEFVVRKTPETPSPVPTPQKSDGPGPNRVPARAGEGLCRKVAEPEGVPAAYPEAAAKGFSLCLPGWAPISTHKTTLWALADKDGNELLRVAVGAGSVTAAPGAGLFTFGNTLSLFSNSRILTGDNALIAVAALQASPGAEVWFVSGRSGQPLLAWLWSRAPIVLVLGLLALALWLWRASARFGPIEASAPLARRSMSEQISGTATFLWHRSPEALHAAQVRALDEAATLRLRQYARLDRVDRAAAIAAATGIGASALNRALNWAAAQGDHALPRVLTSLETARRRLLGRARTPPPISSRRAIQTITPEASQ